MSDIAKVYPPGQEKATPANVTGSAVRPNGSELTRVEVKGSENAKGNQDLAK